MTDEQRVQEIEELCDNLQVFLGDSKAPENAPGYSYYCACAYAELPDTIKAIGDLLSENRRLAAAVDDASARFFAYEIEILCLKERIGAIESLLKSVTVYRDREKARADKAEKRAEALEQWHASILTGIRKRLHDLSYESIEWTHNEHPRIVELTEIDDLMDEFDNMRFAAPDAAGG